MAGESPYAIAPRADVDALPFTVFRQLVKSQAAIRHGERYAELFAVLSTIPYDELFNVTHSSFPRTSP